jgi:hypothetical protein
MKIIRPVQVKVILTEKAKKELETEYDEQFQQLQLELEQLRFQSKKFMQENEKKFHDLNRLAQERLKKEETKKREQLEQTKFKLDQLRLIPLGTEIQYTTVDQLIDVRVGDDWESISGQAEIIIKDGMIHEIREGR